jgi:hypothetical protein
MGYAMRAGYLGLWLLLDLGVAVAVAQPLSVPNAGFEQVDERTGLPVGWTTWAVANTCAYTLAMARGGVACARVTDPSETVSQGLRSPRVHIEPGRAYEATVWVRIADLQAGGFALYLEFWRGPERLQDTSVSTSQQGDWAQLKVAAQAPADAEVATLLVYGASASVGEAYFDDAVLGPVASP